MASISSGTMHSVKKTVKTKKTTTIGGRKVANTKKTLGKGALKGSRGKAPSLMPKAYNHPSKLETLSNLSREEQSQTVLDLVKMAVGEPTSLFQNSSGMASPHTASTSQDRMSAAADVAIISKHLGVVKVLKQMKVLDWIEKMLIPEGIGAMFRNSDGTTNGGGMKKIASAISLSSMVSLDSKSKTELDSFGTGLTDSKRGKQTPPNAREGALLILRALCEKVGRMAEPFVIPLLAAALDEGASSNSSVRTAAEDTAKSMIKLASPLACPKMICPVLFAAMKSPEWRVKVLALECLSELSSIAPIQVSRMLPALIPSVTDTVWDTKPQVTKAARQCLHQTFQTNENPDVSPAIPAIVNAIVKPADTVKAIDELMATTFVASVDSSTLAILCPILSRGLKDKLAINKRSCCLVIQNMSRLVETPEAVAPFGPLLVPDLKKVVENVQFEEIRDAALAALETLTKALGHGSIEEAYASNMEQERKRVLEEQNRIKEERDEEARRAEESKKKEEEERILWKQAMDAQRQLDQLAIEEEAAERKKNLEKKEKKKNKDENMLLEKTLRRARKKR